MQHYRVINNTESGNCSSRQWQNGDERKTMATYLQANGYATFYGGKYLNQVYTKKELFSVYYLVVGHCSLADVWLMGICVTYIIYVNTIVLKYIQLWKVTWQSDAKSGARQVQCETWNSFSNRFMFQFKCPPPFESFPFEIVSSLSLFLMYWWRRVRIYRVTNSFSSTWETKFSCCCFLFF